MPIWTLRCRLCGRTFDQTFPTVKDRDAWLPHLCCDDPCLGALEVVPSPTAFQVRGFNAKNGYSR